MGLYDRDYRILHDEEKREYEQILVREREGMRGIIRRNLYYLYPKAARHFYTLFPNNYLDPFDLRDKGQRHEDIESLRILIGSGGSKERQILNLISERKSYFIVGSILKENYNFGHHGAYVFPEFPLGSAYKVDYLLIGENSDGHHFVFVEMESPGGRTVLSDGNFGEALRSGINQTQDWNSWLENDFPSLRSEFAKHIKRDDKLPDKFYRLDKTRIHYVVVAGVREEFSQKTRARRRKFLLDSEVRILHYNNLIDGAQKLIENNLTY